MSKTNLNSPGDTYAVIDLEYLFDREAHARYLEGEREDAKPKIRWPFRHVVAASIMLLRVTGDAGGRQLEVVQFRTFGRPEQSEHEIVGSLFDQLLEHPSATVVTWGGEGQDLAVLRAAALAHGLRLPAQLHAKAIHYRQPPRRHLDLAIAVKGNAEYVHLAELAMRASIPCKVKMKAHEVGKAAERGRWSEVKEQAEIDVIATALMLGRFLFATGEIDGSAWSADAAIGYSVLRSHFYRAYAKPIQTWLDARGSSTLRLALPDDLDLAA